METAESHAINAIWKTDLKSPEEKLILYQLASKHELGERYSSSWKHIDQFLKDFKTRWCPLKELKDSTQLSDVKLKRTLAELLNRKYIESNEIPVKLKRNRENSAETQSIYAITPKIFEEFATVVEEQQVSNS